MNYSTYRVPLDVHTTTSQATLSVKKNDNARQFQFTLTDGGKPYAILADCTAVFRAKKPDGTILYNNCTIADNIISYTLTTQTVATVGIVECEVTLYGATNKQITSPRFTMLVEDTLYSDSEVESEDEFTELTEAISSLATLENTVETAEASRVSAESLRESAENTRQSNETTRQAKWGSVSATASASDTATASVTQDGNGTHFTFGLPKGDKGDRGEKGEKGDRGSPGGASDWSDITNKPSTFPPSSHNHDERYYTETEIDTKLTDKADTDGSYEEMSVGRLLPTLEIEDKSPYLFRTSGGSLDIGSDGGYSFEDNTIVGGTVAWNQLVQNANKNGANTVVDDARNLIFRIIKSASPYTVFFSEEIISPKIVQVIFTCTTDCTEVSFFHTGHIRNVYFFNLGHGMVTGHKYYVNINFTGVDITTVGGVTWDNAFLIDLTQMFGSAIANTMTVDTFKAMFPKPYYAYNTGELLSVNASSHNTVGFNQWDEEWELGGYAYATGLPIVLTDRIRSKNRNRILPNTTYFCKSSAKQLSMFYYDAGDNFISYVNANNSTVTTPENAYYFRFMVQPTYGTTYNNDICINLSHTGYRNGEYEPYKKNTYPLDSSLTLRGVPKLDGRNNLYYDGDTYEADGTVTRRYGVVDLGTLTWYYDTSQTYPFFYTSKLSAGIVKTIGLQPVVCSKYARTSLNANMSDNTFSTEPDGTYAYHYSGNGINSYIYIKDTSFTDAAAFKASLSGVYLVYELATPTTESALPYQVPQMVDDYGTEEYVATEQSGVSVPVGHITKYQSNLRDKLQRLPSIPKHGGDYIIHYDETTGTSYMKKAGIYQHNIVVNYDSSTFCVSLITEDSATYNNFATVCQKITLLAGYNNKYPCSGGSATNWYVYVQPETALNAKIYDNAGSFVNTREWIAQSPTVYDSVVVV